MSARFYNRLLRAQPLGIGIGQTEKWLLGWFGTPQSIYAGVHFKKKEVNPEVTSLG